MFAQATSPCGSVLFEELSVFTAPGLLENALKESEPLRNSGAQLDKLNTALPTLRLPDYVVPMLVRLMKLTISDIRPILAPFQKLAECDPQLFRHAMIMSHACKKVFPTELTKHLPVEVIAPFLAVYLHGALPHTCGCRPDASLFHKASQIPKTHDAAIRPPNVVYDCSMYQPGNKIKIQVIASCEIVTGDALVFPSHSDLWADLISAGECREKMPSTLGSGLNPSLLLPGGGLQASAQKLSLSLTASDPNQVIQTDLPGRGGDGRVCFTLDNVFTKEECAAMSQLAFRSWDNTVPYRQILKTGPPGNYRLLLSGSDVHEALWQRIQKYCPTTWNGWDVGDLNERMRFIQYDKGERFMVHTDGEYSIDEGTRTGWRSFLTVQVYLTEGMTGGATRFVKIGHGNTAEDTICDCVPKIGRVIVFEHCMRHTGEEVTNDVKKQIIRTEIMFRPSQPKYKNEANQSLPAAFQIGADGLNLPHSQTMPS